MGFPEMSLTLSFMSSDVVFSRASYTTVMDRLIATRDPSRDCKFKRPSIKVRDLFSAADTSSKL
jgi:hypothetical protein